MSFEVGDGVYWRGVAAVVHYHQLIGAEPYSILLFDDRTRPGVRVPDFELAPNGDKK